MFKSIYSKKLAEYYNLRSAILSDSARKHELCYLLRFDTHISSRLKSFGGITEIFINEWVETLSGKVVSKANEIIVVRGFLRYLHTSGEKVALPIVPKIHEDYIPYIFSDFEIELIFQTADNFLSVGSRTDPYLDIEFPVILRLLFSCGCRIGETLSIKMCDVDLASGILRMTHTKNNKQRIVPISSGMKDILVRYCSVMNDLCLDTGWLFPSSKDNKHISDRAVKHRFECILKNNNIGCNRRVKHERGPCLHCFRHLFAFKSFAKAEHEGRRLDDTIPFLSIYLGHEGLYETAKYLKFSNEIFPESIDSFGSYMDSLLPEVNYET